MADIVSEIGSAGDFATLQLWADDIGTNASGIYDGGPHVAIARLLESQANASGWMCDFPAANVTNPISGAIIEPNAGLAHQGNVGGGILLTQQVANYPCISASAVVDYTVEIRDLEIYLSPSSGTVFSATGVDARTTQEVIVKRCIIHSNAYGADSGQPSGIAQGATSACRAIRCLIFNIENSTLGNGFGMSNVTTSWNCSVYNCRGDGVAGSSVTKDPRNCISMDSGTADYSGALVGTQDKNMSSDATAPGTTVYQNEVSNNIWTDPSANDFTLLSGTNAIGTGDDLGTAYDANIDITGATVTGPWSLGAYHLASSADVVAAKARTHGYVF